MRNVDADMEDIITQKLPCQHKQEKTELVEPELDLNPSFPNNAFESHAKMVVFFTRHCCGLRNFSGGQKKQVTIFVYQKHQRNDIYRCLDSDYCLYIGILLLALYGTF